MGGVGKNGYMYMYGWISSPFTWNYHNILIGIPQYKMFLMLKKIKINLKKTEK